MTGSLGRSVPPSPVTADEVAAVRRPTLEARMLPPRVFHDPEVFVWEQEAWFARGWICVGREEDAAETGAYFLTAVAGESVIVVRGDDGALCAFFNVCRHRGATLLSEPCGRLVRFQCPYHAWVYDLAGRLRQPRHTEPLRDFVLEEHSLVPVRLSTWQGFVFLDLSGEEPPLGDVLDDLPATLARYDLAGLRRARRIEYDVRANWKAIVENYEECYHCPGVHPQLNRITPYDLGDYLPSRGPWLGSWMEVVGDYETLSTDGATHGRPEVPGTEEGDRQRIYYFVVWPNLLLSLHPDYLMAHLLFPVAPGQTRILCDWYVAPDAFLAPDFDPSDAIDFWDLTNRQDWEVCERQQAGTASRAYTAGRYSAIESSVHGFDLMVADRYAGDGQVTRYGRVVKAGPGRGRVKGETGAASAATRSTAGRSRP